MAGTGRQCIPAVLAALLSLVFTAAAGAQEDVLIELEQFGVGSSYRPGEFVGIRLKVTALPEGGIDEKGENVWVQWELPNADGDIVEYGRPLALTRGASRRVWLYAKLPPDPALSNAVWPVSVYAYENDRIGRELGGERISAPPAGMPRVDAIETGMIAYVGTSSMGLNQLQLARGPRGTVRSAHEQTRIVPGLRPADFPDRWEGLKQFEAIAWSGASPGDLNSAQIRALVEYVRRGGHLIISLPATANPWALGEPGRLDSTLADLLPTQAPLKQEGVPLQELMPIVAKARKLAPDANFTVTLQVFEDLAGDLNRIDNKYVPILALPDGRVVVIQRIFGHGRISLIGLDLSDSRLTGGVLFASDIRSPLPQADVFWNRILGRRADTPLPGELSEIEDAGRLAYRSIPEKPIGSGAMIRQQINLQGEATKGLLLALLLFLGYWIIAGPGGFVVLKQYGLVRHAWLGFAFAAVVFTVLAWGGVTVLREGDTDVKHLTVLDHIVRTEGDWGDFDPQLQRAVSWFSLYVPGYADTSIGIESMPEEYPVPQQRDLLASWEPPGTPVQKFPDVDRYRVDVGEQPDDYIVPARSTATQLYANWLGALDPSWGGTLREDPADPIRYEVNSSGEETLTGSLISDLSGPLDDVTMIWVRSQRRPNRMYQRSGEEERPWVAEAASGDMLALGRMAAVPGAWQPGESIELDWGEGTSKESDYWLDRNIRRLYFDKYLGDGITGQISRRDEITFLKMLSIYQQLKPPIYLRSQPGQTAERSMVARRSLARELDLSPWFVRPCLIVMGVVENSSCPIPLRVNGRPVKSTGRTFVRWILPLDVKEEIAFPIAEDKSETTASEESEASDE
jgi:hypothetical protein